MYCKTKQARKHLGSYEPEEIISRVSSVLSQFVMEIWLTSEDVGAYGKDINSNIIILLKGIVKAMDDHSNQKAMLRVGMTNPPYILEHSTEMSSILNHPRVYAFLHVPVQAGSNRVLNDMRRLYVKEEFMHVIDVLRENVLGITIATDVICGMFLI
jgi:threonylcarbamoyladenosine tRNA methylthiotransferase CDKAL1